MSLAGNIYLQITSSVYHNISLLFLLNSYLYMKTGICRKSVIGFSIKSRQFVWSNIDLLIGVLGRIVKNQVTRRREYAVFIILNN